LVVSQLERVSQFLFKEARLVDDRKFEEWLELFTSDGVYWIPADPSDVDPDRQVSLVYDSKVERELRIKRLLGRFSPTQDPPPQTLHYVTNVTVQPGQDDTHLEVLSNQLISQVRGEDEYTFQARCIHTLRTDEDNFGIAFKKVSLLGSPRPIGVMIGLL
jgi:3-phenylpropionate/cinnamic acid dioxygenase small subunit